MNEKRDLESAEPTGRDGRRHASRRANYRVTARGMPTVFIDEAVLPQSFLVEWDEIPDGPHVAIEFTSSATPAVVVESVHIRRRPEGRSVQVSDFKHVSPEQEKERAMQVVAMRAKTETGDGNTLVYGPPADYAEGRDNVRTVHRAESRARPSRYTSEKLKEVARVYSTNVEHAPTKAVAAHFKVAHRTAALYVKKAREAGHLPPLQSKDGQDE